MGLNSENASPVVFDLETVAHEQAADYIPPPDLDSIKAPSNYVKETAIEDYVRRERVKRLDDHKEMVDRCALDPDLCRIVALGWMRPRSIVPTVMLCRSEADEAQALAVFWNSIPGSLLVGFNVAGFDVPVLLRRSLLLGIKAPAIPLSKYRHPTVVDLMQILSFDGLLPWRKQSFYLKRFGLTAAVPEDSVTGAQIGGLVAAGDWDSVRTHVTADVLGAMALARHVGVVEHALAES